MKRFIAAIRLVGLVLSFSLLTASCQSGVDLFNRLSDAEREFVGYVLENAVPMDIEDTDSFQDLKPLEDMATRSRVFMYGESHGMVENYRLGLKMMKYLHTIGYRYLALETDWAYTDLLNDYLRTGDRQLIEGMDKWTYPNASNNEDSFEFYKNLYEWNRSLPKEQRITVWGTDIAHGGSATVNKVREGILTMPDKSIADELAAALDQSVNPTRSYAKLKAFELTFLQKTDPIKQAIEGYDKLALYIRVLKDTEAWRSVDTDKAIAGDYPGVEDIREQASLAIWTFMLNRLEPEDNGKILFHGGSWHAVIDVREGPTERIGVLLNETLPQTKGQVCTLAAIPVSGKTRKANGENANVQTYSGRAKMRASLARLPDRWSLVINDGAVYFPDGGLYNAYIILKDCTAARNRP